jgi:hypothetical protein
VPSTGLPFSSPSCVCLRVVDILISTGKKHGQELWMFATIRPEVVQETALRDGVKSNWLGGIIN